MTLKWILLLIGTVAFVAGALYYVYDMKKLLKEEQDDFYNPKPLLKIAAQEVKTFSDAVVFGDFDRVKKMIQDKPEIVNSQDNYGFSALHNVMSEEQFEIVAYLIKNDANVNIQNDRGISPLHLAGWPENVTLLLNAGAEINIIDHQGNTPLHSIAQERDEVLGVLVVDSLVSNGATINLKNKDGKTPLDIASEAKNERIITYLNSLNSTAK